MKLYDEFPSKVSKWLLKTQWENLSSLVVKRVLEAEEKPDEEGDILTFTLCVSSTRIKH
jgi:hypothetical protein